MKYSIFIRYISLIFLIVFAAMTFTSCIGDSVNERKMEVYDILYKPMVEYIAAQESAHERDGTYKPLFDLVQQGYLPGHFPRSNPRSDTYFELAESNLSEDTFTVRARPIGSHFDSYRIEPLWADQTGIIHIGSLDGPEFEPARD